jgi:hypothetical protein
MTFVNGLSGESLSEASPRPKELLAKIRGLNVQLAAWA